MYGFEAFEIDHAMAGVAKADENSIDQKKESNDDNDDDDDDDDHFASITKKIKEENQQHLMHLNFGADDTTSASNILLNALIMLLDGEVRNLLQAQGRYKATLLENISVYNPFTPGV